MYHKHRSNYNKYEDKPNKQVECEVEGEMSVVEQDELEVTYLEKS